MIDGKNKDELMAAFKQMSGREIVKRVTIDLSETFRSVVEQSLPNAKIIADRFHVQRLFTKRVNAARKKITSDKRTHPMRKLLLRNESNLQWYERRAVREWRNFHPEVRELWEYKEAMRRVYETKGLQRAHKALTRLTDRMGQSKLVEARELRRSLLAWRNETLAYHDGRLSNGRTEGFNRKAKLCQRAAYGNRRLEN